MPSTITPPDGGMSQMPVAVVGMSCRLSGIATNPEGLWQMLSKGLNGWSSSAGERFNLESFWHPKPDMNGSFNTRGLHLLKQNPAHFDNTFFGISNVEAKAIDPQQRLLLEVAYEAFENAGLKLELLEGSNTGVFCCVSNHDYEAILGRDPELSPTYRFTGTGPALVSNRISYVFDLHGPSITIDTACSSCLVAIHEACKSIRIGEVKQAIVGGTNLILDPDKVTVMSSLQFLSPHGRCYAFDSRANGFSRGEGVAAVILKPLVDAIRDGDSIRAVIRGSSITQDGKTAGITVPSQAAQVSMIRKAYDDAGLDMRDTLYVEAHGTGTVVGDRTEAGALSETFCKNREEGNKLYVGSVKGNVGHTESAAGLVGLVKAILVLENGLIPPQATFIKPSKDIPLHDMGIEVPRRMVPWPENTIRRASVNSFGYGGTNAHVILEAAEDYYRSSAGVHLMNRSFSTANGDISNAFNAPDRNGYGFESNGMVTKMIANISNGHHDLRETTEARSTSDKASQRKLRLFVVSHANEHGATKLATNYMRFLSNDAWRDDDMSLARLAYTLSDRRSHLKYRVAIPARDKSELLEVLNEVSKGTIRAQKSTKSPTICFAFTGQGAQWAEMGRDLLGAYPLFAEAMENAEKYLLSLGADWHLLTELAREKEFTRINEATLSQPCCTAIQMSLVDLLKSFGIQPKVLCGHSSGEIAAAYAAGILTPEDALRIAYYRGECVRRLKERNKDLSGGMVAVGLSADKVKAYLDSSSGKVVLACINSPNSVTLSGDTVALKEVQQKLENDKIFNRALIVDVAYHSHHMEIIHEEYVSDIRGIKPKTAHQGLHVVSSVTGKEIDGKTMDEAYWGLNLVSTVQFVEALGGAIDLIQQSSAISSGASQVAIVEVGPHSALAGPIKQIIKARNYSILPTYHSVLSRNENSVYTTLRLAGELFTRGASIDFSTVNKQTKLSRSDLLTTLPPYNWNHGTSHWNESRGSTEYRQRNLPRHDILGVRVHDGINDEPSWRNYLRLSELPWITGHRIGGQNIFPAAGYISMVVEALRDQTFSENRLWKDLSVRFRQIDVGRALLVSEDNTTGVEVLIRLRPYTHSAREASKMWKEFHVFSISDKGESTEHCHGLVTTQLHPVAANSHQQPGLSEKEAEAKCRLLVDPKKFYNELARAGVEYSGPFANLEYIRASPTESFCRLKVPNTKELMPSAHHQPHCVHPSTLDLCFQTLLPLSKAKGQILPGVIASIDELEISSEISAQPGTELMVNTVLKRSEQSKRVADIFVRNKDAASSSPLIKVSGINYAAAESGAQNNLYREDGELLCHKMEWGLDIASSDDATIMRHCKDYNLDPMSLQRRQLYDEFVRSVIHNTLQTLSADEEANVTGHLSHMLAWMKSQHHGYSIPLDGALKKKVASYGVDGEALVRVSDHIGEILRGAADPLSVLLQDDLLFRVYSNSNINRCNNMLAQYAHRLQFKNPNMRILEIGAGTASTTLPVLEALFKDKRSSGLAKLDKYVFTDISSGFFETARSKLQNFEEVLEFQKLDIESPIEEQGFNPGSFDLIIASNVLHATRTMKKTMANVRSLLKPSGKLALVEVTAPSLCWKMVFGILPGWWHGAEDGRTDSPLLSSSSWDHLLRATGFTGVDVDLKDFPPEEGHEISTLISTATSNFETVLEETVHVLCNKEDDEIAMAVSASLMKLPGGQNVKTVPLANFTPHAGIVVVLLEALEPFLASCSEDQWEKVKSMFSCASGVLWVTKGGTIECDSPHQGMIVGLARCIRSENHSLKLVTVDLEAITQSAGEMAQHICRIYQNSFGSQALEKLLPEWEYAIRNGEVLVPRLVEDKKLDEYVQDSVSKYHPRPASISDKQQALSLRIGTPGLLETFYWEENELHSRKPNAHEVRVKLQYIALNFKDLMIAMGQLDGHTAILIEATGTVVEVGDSIGNRFSVGDSVAVFGHESLATTCNVEYWNVQKVPEGMSMELATAVTLAYRTALYSLRNIAQLQEGESVLIHCGAGELGQAAVALAQYYKAGQIFVTVGSAEKRAFMKENFGIPDENLFSSRDLSFGRDIIRRTNGRGVDIILNSLSGDAIRENCTLLAPFGRFVELGKKDLVTNGRLEMQHLEPNITFAAVDLSMIGRDRPKIQEELFSSVMDLIGSGKVKALRPITVKPISEVEDAFRMMQAGKHLGKLILRIDPSMKIQAQPRKPSLARLQEDFSYLIVGGSGGIGRELIRYFAKMGAKHIVTLSRSGSDGQNIKLLIEEMRNEGVELLVHKGSAARLEDVQALKELTRQHPIRGVIQGAMVLQDSTVSNMSYGQWRAAVEPKVEGTWNIHTVFGESLNFFVLLSSVAGNIGSSGQGNYCAGNTFQDAFARHRASLGLPVRTIDVGLVEGEGYTAENVAAADFIYQQGIRFQKLSELLAVINNAIQFPMPGGISAAQSVCGTNREDPASGTDVAALQRPDPRFSHMWNKMARAGASGGASHGPDVKASLRMAKTEQEVTETLLTALVAKLCRLLAVPMEELGPDRSVAGYGVDSLIAVELRNWVSSQLEAHVQTFELLSPMSMRELAQMHAKRSLLVSPELFHEGAK